MSDFTALPDDLPSARFTDFEGDSLDVTPMSDKAAERHYLRISVTNDEDTTTVWLSPVEALALASVINRGAETLGLACLLDGTLLDSGDPNRPAYEVV